jgi:hypothetical protein
MCLAKWALQAMSLLLPSRGGRYAVLVPESPALVPPMLVRYSRREIRGSTSGISQSSSNSVAKLVTVWKVGTG